jgi:phosphopantetheine--protein transferase-like protein
MDLVDSKGRLIIQFEGWEDVCFFGWTPLFLFSLDPCGNFLSTPWLSPVVKLPDAGQFRITLCTQTPSGIRLRALAQVTLNRKERKVWSQRSGPESRRRQWLLGRLAAKDAVRLILKDLYQVEACPADVQILADEYGRPFVSGELIEKHGCCLCLSIAHSKDTSVAVVAECKEGLKGVGIDIERIDQNHDGLEDGGFTKPEISFLDNAPDLDRNEWLLRLWCAKEALAKALGLGLMGNPSHYLIKDVSFETGQICVMINHYLAKDAGFIGDVSFNVQTGCDQKIIYGIAYI